MAYGINIRTSRGPLGPLRRDVQLRLPLEPPLSRAPDQSNHRGSTEPDRQRLQHKHRNLPKPLATSSPHIDAHPPSGDTEIKTGESARGLGIRAGGNSPGRRARGGATRRENTSLRLLELSSGRTRAGRTSRRRAGNQQWQLASRQNGSARLRPTRRIRYR